MSYEFYKVLHLTGIILTIIALAGIIPHIAGGGTKKNLPLRKLLAASHGIGLLLALTGGFGLLARLGMARDVPAWAWAKLVIWLVLGALLAVVYKGKKQAKASYWVLIVLFVTATYLARYKPF